MKKRTLSFLLSMLCVLSLLLNGCGQDQQPSNTPDDAQSGVQDQQIGRAHV